MNIEKQIEFDKVKEIWSALAVTTQAKEQIAGTYICLSESELETLQRDTTNAKDLIERLGTPPLQDVEEVKEIIMIADKGECLTPHQLERVQTVLSVIKRFMDYLDCGKVYQNSLAFYAENFDCLPSLRDEIAQQIRNGAVDDYATKELSQLRNQISKAEEQMKQKAEIIMRNQKDCMADNFCTMRNGRVCIPVKKDCKFKIPGSVIDKSSTGSTLFIEPTSVAKIYEELQALKFAEEDEVRKILYTLSVAVADEKEIMLQNINMMERLDFILSKGKLSIDLDAHAPRMNMNRIIRMKNARHPLMNREIAIPLQFHIDQETKGIVITGPNTGGKTVAIKTVMLNCIMAQCGLHVTCEEADICMNSCYLCDIGDNQNLSENLSTFSAHIKNVLEVLAQVNKESFVIMDELGSGTDPTEGMGIAIAILEELRKSGAIFLLTTHYPEVKEYVNHTRDVQNARMTFDKETLSPTYQMVIGEAGESCAFYIADRLGMPEEMLKVAVKAAYGEEAIHNYQFLNRKRAINKEQNQMISPKLSKKKCHNTQTNRILNEKYHLGDSVMIYPEKKIAIVCEPINDKGVLRVQLKDRKLWINHKRVKLHVAATELYPPDYDFSIIFDSVEVRKKRHDQERKYVDDILEVPNE